MYIEANKQAIRKNIIESNRDIEYLKGFFFKNKKYPNFSQVQIETRTDCNRHCIFCPQYHYQRRLTIIDWLVFENIIQQLRRINFSGRVALFMTNEPLLENRLIEMVKYTRKQSPRFFIDITSNGSLLSLEMVDSLFESGLDNLNINDYRNNQKENINPILEKIITVYRNNPKISYKVRGTNETLSNYAGIINKKTIKNIGFCSYPFRKLAISANGNVILCCNDYKYSTNYGNILESDLLKIWHNDNLNEIRHQLLNGERKMLCSSCDEFQNYSIY